MKYVGFPVAVYDAVDLVKKIVKLFWIQRVEMAQLGS